MLQPIRFFAYLIFLPVLLFAKNTKPQPQQVQDDKEIKTKVSSTSYSSNNGEYLEGMVVIKLKNEMFPLNTFKSGNMHQTQYPFLNKLITKYNIAEIKKAFPNHKRPYKSNSVDLSKIYYIKFDRARDVKQVVESFSNNPNILYAEPVYVFKTSLTPDDPRFSQQGHLKTVEAEAAWDISQGDSSIIVGIVDSGVDLDHPDLSNNIWVNEDEIADNGIDDDENGFIDDVYGWDFIGASFDSIVADNNPDQNTGSDHGTHVAGIAAATGNNGIGVSGMAWNLTIMVTKHSSDTESNSIGFGYDGIIYCADNGADVINCSWGGNQYSSFGQDVINYAYEKGAVVVGAAGNDSPDASYDPPAFNPPHYPSGYDHVLSVAATDNNDNFTSFSYYGTTIDVTAPGQSILSTVPISQGSYTRYDGTSMSSPLVTGLAGLVKSVYPNMTSDQIMNQIKFTSDNIDNTGDNMRYVTYGGIGYGRVNAYRAVTEEPKPFVELLTINFNDSLGGNNNGKPEPGETIYLNFSVSNLWGDAPDLTVMMSSDDYAVVVEDNTSLLGTIPGGTLESSNSSDLMSITISENTLPHRVSITLTFTGGDGYYKEEQIFLSIEPIVLIVDDDDGFNNVEHYYTQALDRLGIVYDIWDHNRFGTPTKVLNSYPNVIWLCEWAFPSLDAKDRQLLASYLNNGGKLFLSGQDIGWDLADASGSDVPNEYGKSEGNSKSFFNTYLKAKYITDISNFDILKGSSGEEIGDGLEFEVYQPGRTGGQQFPSEISPIGGAVSVFEFPNGNSGAIKYEGLYRLVFFAFGGYEAITDSAGRQIVMQRVLGWLNGIEFDHEPLKDSEDTVNNYKVELTLASTVDSLVSINMYWDTDGQFPFKEIPMTELGDDQYSAEIPAQQGGNVQYMIFAKTATGTYTRSDIYQFDVGPDSQPPSLEILNQPNTETVNAYGPYIFKIHSEDNIGVDSARIRLLHWMAEGSVDTVTLKDLGGDEFGTKLYYNPYLEMGDQINYTFSVKDLSLSANEVRSDTFSFTIDSVEILDNFEGPLSKWDLGESWDKTPKSKHPTVSGMYSMTDNPEESYKNNQNNILLYRIPHNLQPYNSAWLDVWVRYWIQANKDFVFVEISGDGGSTWNEIKRYTGAKLLFFNDIIPINDYVGSERDSLLFRFRLQSDSVGTEDGFYIDDLKLTVSDAPPTSIYDTENAAIPNDYYLKQNYPNPFNPSTVIEFGIKLASKVKLNVYNVLGQKIIELTNEQFQAGRYRIDWNGKNANNHLVGSGVYFYHLEVEPLKGKKRTFKNKMVLIR